MQHTETITENHNQSKWRGVESSLSRWSHNATPALKTMGSLQKRGKEILRARKSGSFKRGCISCNIERCNHKISALWLSEHDLNKHNNSHVIMGSWRGSGEQDTLTLYKEQQTTKKMRRVGETILSREENISWLSNTNHQPWKHTYQWCYTDKRH